VTPSRRSPTGAVRAHATYRLVRNTGRKAPGLYYRPRKGGGPVLVDRNTGETIPMPPRQQRLGPSDMAAANG